MDDGLRIADVDAVRAAQRVVAFDEVRVLELPWLGLHRDGGETPGECCPRPPASREPGVAQPLRGERAARASDEVMTDRRCTDATAPVPDRVLDSLDGHARVAIRHAGGATAENRWRVR